MKHTVKKLSSLFLALSLAAGLCLTPALAAKTNYPDAQASWAASSIERWSGSGIVKGDGNGNFNPGAPLSRAELAQIFVNMFGLTEKADNTFGDLKGDEWYADAVLKCAAAGIMKGDGSRVNAGADISRAEAIVMFGRAVGVTPDTKPDLSAFSDGADVADWAAVYLAPFTKMGILSGGGDGTLNANGRIDRASTMALLDKSVAEYVNAPGEYKVDNANGFVIVNVSDKEGEVVISGAAAGVVVSGGTAEGKIAAKDLKADTIKVDGSAKVSVEGKSAVGEIVANAEGDVSIAKGVTVDTVTANSTGTVTNAGTVNSFVANGAATVSNTGTVKELVANAPAQVVNKGTITKAEVKADGVVLDGKKPTTVAVDEGTKNPTDSDGKEIKPGTDKPSFNPGPGYSTYTAATAKELTEALAKAGSGDVVKLTDDIAVEEAVIIEKAITLDGNGKTITTSNGYAIQAYNAGKVTLKNISAVGAEKGAVLVNGSTVTLAGTVTVTGTWGGIEVGQGIGVANPGVLNIGSATLVHAAEAADKPTVWTDSADKGTVNGDKLFERVQPVSGGRQQVYYFITDIGSRFTSGAGTEASPYVVTTTTEFAAIFEGLSDTQLVYYKLGNDLNLKDNTNCGTRLLENAVFDGDNHKIFSSAPVSLSGVFDYVQGKAVIKNLTYDLTNCNYDLGAKDSVGLVKTAMGSDVLIEQVTVEGTHSVDGNNGVFVFTEAIPANGTLTLKDCTYAAHLQGTGYNACFVGFQSPSADDINCEGLITFEGCAVTGTLVCPQAAVFVANGSHAYNRTYVFTDNTMGDNAMIRGTEEAKLFTAVSIQDDVQETAAKESFAGDTSAKVYIGQTDAALAITEGEGGALTLTASENNDITYYVVEIGIYTNYYNGEGEKDGTWLFFARETIDTADHLSVTLKKLHFVDSEYPGLGELENIVDGVKVAECGGTKYYVVENYTDSSGQGYVGSPDEPGMSPASIVRVSAYLADGTMYSSATLS